MSTATSSPTTSRPPSTLVCTVTPFDAEGRLDEDALRLLVKRYASAGVGTFLASSSPGEGFALSLDETERLYAVAKETMGGRAPVRAMGIEPHDANETLAILRVAESVGLDAMQLYCLDCSHGNRPTDGELEAFLRTILERMSIPAVLSTHFLLGYMIPLDVIERLLADYPHIIGINASTNDLGYLTRLTQLVDNRVDVHVGGPMHALAGFALGAQGFLSTEGAIAPKLCASVIEGYARGDQAATFDAYRRLMQLSSVNMWPGGSVRFIKTALRILGQPGWHTRPPYLALDESVHADIRLRFEELRIAESEQLAPVTTR
jgi:4-hydroxy-tetrahydrodipicolinate synthase